VLLANPQLNANFLFRSLLSKRIHFNQKVTPKKAPGFEKTQSLQILQKNPIFPLLSVPKRRILTLEDNGKIEVEEI